MKIVFMGTPAFSVPILEALCKTYEVVLVVTQPDMPVGRKRVLSPPPVKTYALSQGLSVFQPLSIKKDYQVILDSNPDIIITAAYGQIIPETLLNFPPFKAVNVHASLLPKYRGGAPIQRAIMALEKETGITIMMMSKKMDAGAILAQEAIPITTEDTAESLFNKLALIGRDLLLKTLPKIFDKTIEPIKQDESLVTYAFNLKPEEEALNFNESVFSLEAKIRAFYKEPNTFTFIQGQKLKVIKAQVHQCSNFIKHHKDDENGTVIKVFDNGIGVKCTDGVLILTEVQLAGKKAMSAKDFMNGSGRQLINVGSKLGE
jgi:methionyl-tRNA formyltransferase